MDRLFGIKRTDPPTTLADFSKDELQQVKKATAAELLRRLRAEQRLEVLKAAGVPTEDHHTVGQVLSVHGDLSPVSSRLAGVHRFAAVEVDRLRVEVIDLDALEHHSASACAIRFIRTTPEGVSDTFWWRDWGLHELLGTDALDSGDTATRFAAVSNVFESLCGLKTSRTAAYIAADADAANSTFDDCTALAGPAKARMYISAILEAALARLPETDSDAWNVIYGCLKGDQDEEPEQPSASEYLLELVTIDRADEGESADGADTSDWLVKPSEDASMEASQAM